MSSKAKTPKIVGVFEHFFVAPDEVREDDRIEDDPAEYAVWAQRALEAQQAASILRAAARRLEAREGIVAAGVTIAITPFLAAAARYERSTPPDDGHFVLVARKVT